MGIFEAFSISASGLAAERVRMEIIAENIANINTTRQEGKKIPYQRKEVIFEEIVDSQKRGVKVASIEEDNAPPIAIYSPSHPDADSKGYVYKPNIDLHFEMVDLLSAARAYQANLVAMRTYKQMVERTLAIGG